MRKRGPCHGRAAGVRAIGDNDYYHAECTGEHDQDHNDKEQHLLSAGIRCGALEYTAGIEPELSSTSQQRSQLTRKEIGRK
jgi:hypothetical protein